MAHPILQWLGCLLTLSSLMPDFTQAEQPMPSVSFAAIGAGQPLWVDSQPDPEFALINARVDIGTLHRVEDQLEVQMQWPSSPGLLNLFRADHPNLSVPDASQFIDRERVVCSPDGMISFRVESTVLAPDGAVIYHQSFDPIAKRMEAEAKAKELQTRFSSRDRYGPDPRSLVCWAAARRCEKQDFSWPPPPNETPLEESERATQMQNAYNRLFFPTCQ